MGSIKTTVSAVGAFVDASKSGYGEMIALAQDVLSKAEGLYHSAEAEKEKIEAQVAQANALYNEISAKVNFYEARMDDALYERQSYEEEIEYIYNNPITITETDEEGNETTREIIDTAALRAAERGRDNAQQEYEMYSEKYYEASAVRREVDSIVYRFEMTKKGVEAAANAILQDTYQIKKYIGAMEEESAHNVQALTAVYERLQDYLASKAIFMPSGATYMEFAGGGSSFYGGSSGGAGGGSVSVGDKSAASNSDHGGLDEETYRKAISVTSINNGTWKNSDGSAGVRGESKWCPSGAMVKRKLAQFGVDGIEYKNGLPDFSPVSNYECKLDESEYFESDSKQFESCSEALLEDYESGKFPWMKEFYNFDEDQLYELECGKAPYGYKWHHATTPGVLQLVPTSIHEACRHMGGRSLWGGGAKCR